MRKESEILSEAIRIIEREVQERSDKIMELGETIISKAVDLKMPKIDVIVTLADLIKTFAEVPQPDYDKEDGYDD